MGVAGHSLINGITLAIALGALPLPPIPHTPLRCQWSLAAPLPLPGPPPPALPQPGAAPIHAIYTIITYA